MFPFSDVVRRIEREYSPGMSSGEQAASLIFAIYFP